MDVSNTAGQPFLPETLAMHCTLYCLKYGSTHSNMITEKQQAGKPTTAETGADFPIARAFPSAVPACYQLEHQ